MARPKDRGGASSFKKPLTLAGPRSALSTHLDVAPEVKTQLTEMSTATIDRALREVKGVTGGGLPALIWRAFMEEALAPEIAAAQASARERVLWEADRDPMPGRPDDGPSDWTGPLGTLLLRGPWF